MPANLENSAVVTDWKRSVFIPIPKKGNAKECSNYCTIALISHASKLMFKFLQARLQQYMNYEFPDVQAGFRKGRGTRDQIANLCWIIEKAREFQNNKELTHWKRPWCWERLKAGGEGDDRRWDGWMASPTQWTWVWVNSMSWWWTGRPGVLQSMGSQRVGHEWVTELNWLLAHLSSLHPWCLGQSYYHKACA